MSHQKGLPAGWKGNVRLSDEEFERLTKLAHSWVPHLLDIAASNGVRVEHIEWGF